MSQARKVSLQGAHGGADRLVAGGMAMGVVDPLEMVDVQHHHRQRAIISSRAGKLFSPPFQEAAAVQGAGQGVGGRQPFQVALHRHDAGGGQQARRRPFPVQRLAQELVGAGLHQLVELVGHAAGDHQDQIEMAQPLGGAQVPAQFQPGHVVQPDVGHHHVEPFARHRLDGGRAGLDHAGGVAELVQLVHHHGQMAR